MLPCFGNQNQIAPAPATLPALPALPTLPALSKDILLKISEDASQLLPILTTPPDFFERLIKRRKAFKDPTKFKALKNIILNIVHVATADDDSLTIHRDRHLSNPTRILREIVGLRPLLVTNQIIRFELTNFNGSKKISCSVKNCLCFPTIYNVVVSDVQNVEGNEVVVLDSKATDVKFLLDSGRDPPKTSSWTKYGADPSTLYYFNNNGDPDFEQTEFILPSIRISSEDKDYRYFGVYKLEDFMNPRIEKNLTCTFLPEFISSRFGN